MTRQSNDNNEESMTVSFSRNLNEVKDLAILNDKFSEVLLERGFEQWAYVSFHPDGKPYIFTKYPEQWMVRYHEEQYLNIDPIIQTSINATTPYFWKDVVRGIEMTKTQQQFFSEARDFGLNNGIGIPTWENHSKPGLVSIPANEMNGEDFNQHLTTNKLDLLAITNLFHIYSQKLLLRPKHKRLHNDIQLTRKEQQCLDLLILGYSNNQIAENMGSSSRAISFHVENVKTKYGVKNRIQLLSKFLQE